MKPILCIDPGASGGPTFFNRPRRGLLTGPHSLHTWMGRYHNDSPPTRREPDYFRRTKMKTILIFALACLPFAALILAGVLHRTGRGDEA